MKDTRTVAEVESALTSTQLKKRQDIIRAHSAKYGNVVQGKSAMISYSKI